LLGERKGKKDFQLAGRVCLVSLRKRGGLPAKLKEETRRSEREEGIFANRSKKRGEMDTSVTQGGSLFTLNQDGWLRKGEERDCQHRSR